MKNSASVRKILLIIQLVGMVGSADLMMNAFQLAQGTRKVQAGRWRTDALTLYMYGIPLSPLICLFVPRASAQSLTTKS